MQKLFHTFRGFFNSLQDIAISSFSHTASSAEPFICSCNNKLQCVAGYIFCSYFLLHPARTVSNTFHMTDGSETSTRIKVVQTMKADPSLSQLSLTSWFMGLLGCRWRHWHEQDLQLRWEKLRLFTTFPQVGHLLFLSRCWAFVTLKLQQLWQLHS